MKRWRRRLTLIVVVTMILVANVAAYGHNTLVDLSSQGRFSLAPESKSLARAVKSHLEITAFLSSVGGAGRDAKFLLARYHELNRRIDYKVVDPDANPGEALRFGINRYSTVVLTYEGRRVDAPDAEELEISTAILRLLRGGTTTVCVLTGHGEPSLTNPNPEGLSKLADLLTTNAYQAKPLDLTTGTGSVPSDCRAVLVIGPVDPLGKTEVDALVRWTADGGGLVVLGTPLTRADPNPFLAPYGIHFIGGLVLDPLRDQGLDLSNVIVEDLPSASPVVAGVAHLQFPASGALTVNAGTSSGLTVERLGITSDQSYVDTHPETSTAFGPGDIPGPVVVAASADDSRVVNTPDPRLPPGTPSTSHIVRTRVVATGDDAWAANQFLDNLGNRRFMVNALAWVTEQEQLVAATSHANDVRPLPLTPERRNQILAVTVGLVPAAIILAGVGEGYLVRRVRRRRARSRSRSASRSRAR